MRRTKNDGLALVDALAGAWGAVERRVGGRLAALHGISLAEFRLLHSLASAPQGRASRVDLARSVGLTPSAVTRALRPLETMAVVETIKNERDARLALATLTPAGSELVAGAASVVSDEMAEIVELTPLTQADWRTILAVLNELARQ